MLKNYIYGHNIPEPIISLFEYMQNQGDVFSELELLAGYSNILGLDFDRGLTIPYCMEKSIRFVDGSSSISETLDSLVYKRTPFEFFPIGYQGGDALQFGYLMLAPELEDSDFPVVSFSPIDEFGLAWLGDNSIQAIESLLTAKLKRINRHDTNRVSELLQNEYYQFLVSTYNLNPDRSNRLITKYGRTDQRVQPSVPTGWKYIQDNMGVGVLAKTETFNQEYNHKIFVDTDNWNSLFEAGEKQLSLGYFGTALYLFRSLFNDAFVLDNHIQLSKIMKEAYIKLDKHTLAKKVDISLKYWGE